MLVLEGQPVGQEFRRVVALRLIILDHLAAAAGIAGDAVHGDRKAGRDEPGLDQRTQRRDRPLRPAAGIGDQLRAGDRLRLLSVHLRKAVGPALGDAMRGRGVDHACAGVADQRHAFLRRIVGQAEDGDVGLAQEIGACGRVLAALDRDRDDLDVVAAGKPRPDLQAGGAVFAVDEDLRFHASQNPANSVLYAACVIHFRSVVIQILKPRSSARRAGRDSASRPSRRRSPLYRHGRRPAQPRRHRRRRYRSG